MEQDLGPAFSDGYYEMALRSPTHLSG